MARISDHESLYLAFEEFLNRCILDEGSLLWPGEGVWTLENVAEVKRRMIDASIPGSELSFEEKLVEQMQGASPEQWMLLCDVYYVYYLPSYQIRFETRQQSIRWAAQHGGRTPPPVEADVWEAQKGGFSRTGYRYHQKYLQFWLILLFADHVKSLPEPQAVVKKPNEMQEVLDRMLESIPDNNDRAYGMRHAMLHLAFPGEYEQIISTADKEGIVKVFGDRLAGDVPQDLDEAIRRIRQILAPEYDTPDRAFGFYDEDVRSQWKADRRTSRTQATKVAEGDKARNGYIVESESLPDELSDVLAILERTRNLILYGPPGTGKTYIAKRAAEAIIEPQLREPLSDRAALLQAIEDLTGYEMLALSLYHSGPTSTFSMPEILEQPLVQVRFQVKPVKYPNNSIWFYLQQHTHPESKTVNVANRRSPYLFDKNEQGRWVLTEEGRVFVEESLADHLTILSKGTDGRTIDTFVMWTTFHQSYAYEDFVEGLRPVSSEDGSGEISYEVMPGAFRRICARAMADPENKYVLVIDEINRGNIAKILGELITLLEDDKRMGQPNALAIVLPYSGQVFSVPSNLYVIGTMNTADRSIALLDVALRRRFAFLELMPQPELLEGSTVESTEATVRLADLLRSLNQGIRRSLDRDHQVGHSYFLEVSRATEDARADLLDFVWSNRIMPLLEEYYYGQRDRLVELLAPFLSDLELEAEGIEAEELGAEIGQLRGEDLLAALTRLADRADRRN